MFIQALPFDAINPFAKLISFFAADAGKEEDKTSKNEDEFGDFEDDIDDAFGEDDDEQEDENEKKDDQEGDDEEEEDDEDGQSKKSDKKSSAVVQKQKYRAKLREALAKIKELEGKKDTQGQLTDEQKKEQAANKFLAEKIQEQIKQMETTKMQQKLEAEERFEDEIDEVLEANSDIKEKQLRDVCDELEISPKQAVKVIKREMKLKGKEKPKIPQPKRGSPEIESDKGKGAKSKPTLDEINRSVKERIRKGEL